MPHISLRSNKPVSLIWHPPNRPPTKQLLPPPLPNLTFLVVDPTRLVTAVVAAATEAAHPDMAHPLHPTAMVAPHRRPPTEAHRADPATEVHPEVPATNSLRERKIGMSLDIPNYPSTDTLYYDK